MKKPFSAVIFAVFVPAVLVLAGNGCSGCRGCNDTDPGPVEAPSSTAPSASGPSTVDLILPDAGDDADADADADASKGGGGASFSGLRACCAALQSNAASAPPPQNMWMTGAAQYCNATVGSLSSPTQKDAMLAQLRTMLRGSALPASCK